VNLSRAVPVKLLVPTPTYDSVFFSMETPEKLLVPTPT
jgi:hypothetical protein